MRRTQPPSLVEVQSAAQIEADGCYVVCEPEGSVYEAYAVLRKGSAREIQSHGWPVYLVSAASPIGRVLSGCRLGDTVTVTAPCGSYTVQVVSIDGSPLLTARERQQAKTRQERERQEREREEQARQEQERERRKRECKRLAEQEVVRQIKARREVAERARQAEELRARFTHDEHIRPKQRHFTKKQV